jgi:hypothetical protein
VEYFGPETMCAGSVESSHFKLSSIRMRALPKALFTACCALGCSQTGIDLILPQATVSTGGAGGFGGSAPDGGLSGGGSGGADSGPPDAGEGGGLGGGSGELDCSNGQSEVSPGYVRIRNVATGLCLGQGDAIEVGGEPAFEVLLVECMADPSQLWRLSATVADSYFVQNVPIEMNLDMQYAGTADGTPAVLFSAHQLDNQRFYFPPLPGGGFWMSPANVPFGGVPKCLRENGSGVELRPCVAGDEREAFQVLDGLCYS